MLPTGLRRKRAKSSSFSLRSLFHLQTLLVIPLICISWTPYKETHRAGGKAGDTVKYTGQQLAAARARLLRCCEIFTVLELALFGGFIVSFSLAASSVRGPGGGETIPVASSNSPHPPAVSVLPHSCPDTHRLGPIYFCPSRPKGGRELPAKPLTPTSTPFLIIKRREHCVTVC